MTTPTQAADVAEEFSASKYGGTADVVIAMSKELARLRAANAALTEALEKISACAPTVLRITKENRESMQPFCIARHALRAALTSVEVPK
jgi:hypothetical protein